MTRLSMTLDDYGRMGARKQIFVVMLEGDYTSSINGQDMTAQRSSVAGAFWTREEAQDAMEAAHESFGNGWGSVTAMWIDTVVIGEALKLD